MKTNFENTSAYQGRGWKPRKPDRRGVWSPYAVNSEWGRLTAVVLYCPRSELRHIRRPQSVQHLRSVALPLLQRQMRQLAATYRRFGVRVIEIDPDRLPKNLRVAPPNLMFARDLFFNTGSGAVVSRMASEVRAGEEKFGAAALAEQGVMVRGSIANPGVFEGSADALWLTPRLVAVGVGARTNKEGLRQLRIWLADQGVECAAIKMPRGVQHLLGFLQVVDRRLAVVRSAKAPVALLRLLKRLKFKIIPVSESVEVREKLGFNFVTLGPRRIVMPSGCPDLRDLLMRAGIRIAAEADISQLCNAAGGIGCVTGILSRRTVR